MAYGSISLEKRIKNNIKNYSLGQLLDISVVQKQLEELMKLTGLEVLVTRRHGEPVVVTGNWSMEIVDVIADPGIKLKVLERTVSHIYYRIDKNSEETKEMLLSLIEGWRMWAENTYLYKETDQYVMELQFQVEEELNRKKDRNHLDALTGTLTHTYFRSRMKVLDRSQTAPISAICININDWKYANNNYGEEESDRLIRIIADILRENAKPDYIIGRVDGDVFNVMIVMPEDGEALEYARKVQEACDSFKDDKLTPSVAIGIAMKENVEEKLDQIFSDAEYEMFENKMAIKKSEQYQNRLKKIETY